MTVIDATSAQQSRGGRLADARIAHEIEFLTARVRALGNARANIALADLGLKVRSYCVLSLACSDLTPSQRELADFLQLDASQIVALVDGLEERALVTRTPGVRDRRSKSIAATPAGRAVYADASARVSAAGDRTHAPLDDMEREQLRGLLRRLAFSDSI